MAYVCLCNSISERKVRKAIAHGADTVDAIARACGAGTTCFGCHDTIEELIDERSVTVARFAPAS